MLNGAGMFVSVTHMNMPPGAVGFNEASPVEAEMRKGALAVFGVLLTAALAFQMPTAIARNARKAVRAPVFVTQPPRDAFGSLDWSSGADPDYSHHRGGQGLSAPATVGNRSCDVIWCYEN